MTTIAEDYVSFEIAKLLKEKGFDNISLIMYKENGEMCINPKSVVSWRLKYWYPCLTLQMAMKWLREIYQIDIQIFRHIRGKRITFYARIEQNTHLEHQDKCNIYQSYEQAAEAAIKYCLENLI